MPSLPAKLKILLVLAKKKEINFSGSAQFDRKTRISLKYFVNDCRCSKSDRSLNFFKKLWDEIMYPANKQTGSGPETAFYYFFQL